MNKPNIHITIIVISRFLNGLSYFLSSNDFYLKSETGAGSYEIKICF